MSLPNRIADIVTGHSKIVIVALLLVTTLAGAGMPMVDDDSSLDQFESESDEAQALEDINDNFVVEDDDENTTSVQLIAKGDNVIAQESLISSLEFQQDIHDNESINDTLVDDDPIMGVENLVAISVISDEMIDDLEDQADDLEERQDELEEESDELEEMGDELEEDAEDLESRADSLESDSASLEEDQAELEEEVEVLNNTLNEVAGLHGLYLDGQLAEPEAEALIDEEIEEAINETNLDEDQQRSESDFRNATDDIQTLVELEHEYDEVQDLAEQDEQADQDDLLAGLEATRGHSAENPNAPDSELEMVFNESTNTEIEETSNEEEYTNAALDVADLQTDLGTQAFELEAAFEETYETGTAGVFAEEFEELESQASSLESRGETLEEDGDELEEREEELEERGDELEERGDELEEDAEALEDDAEELEDLDPTLEEQIEALEDLDDEEYEEAIEDAMTEDDETDDAPALDFMSTDYEPGALEADARMTMITQESEMGDAMGGEEMDGSGDDALDSQLDLRDLAEDDEQEYLVFGGGVLTDEIENSMDDSLAIVGPLALLFVVTALAVAYRDPLDIVLGVVGIIAVLIWTFGFMGWAGIVFNQMMIAVPVLLIGLSIDYAIHVFMRHREQRENEGVDDTVRGSMTIALAGVGVALVWVTATTAIGFLANLVSPIGPIQEFGVVSSVGIIAALIVFGGLIPALKVEIDSFLESRGWSRRKRAFGTGEGRFTSVLTVGSTAARRIPIIVIVAALLLTAGGVYGASQVDTSFEEEDFLAESPPGWTEHLPGDMAPSEYQAADDLEFVNENFQREDSEAQILIEGDITDDDTLQEFADAQDEAAENDIVYTLPNGDADVEDPLTVMEDAAAEDDGEDDSFDFDDNDSDNDSDDDDDSFNDSFTEADTTGDGVPDQNVEELYDELFEEHEDEASNVIHRTDDGEYEAAQLIVGVQGDAGFDETTEELRAIASTIDASGTGDERNLDAGDGELNAIATGDPIVNHIVEQDLLDTVLESLLITLVTVFGFLTVAYWLTGNSAALGTVTLIPVAFAVSWILGTMYLLDIPFNVLTGMITSLTVGMGVAYSIHISARYTLELERQGNAWSAMHTTVSGTGGALLGSAATTVGGFGTLAFAIFPALQQFGIITGLTITYSFLASVIVLPTLLILWTRYFGPDVSFDTAGSTSRAPTASDGGTTTDVDTDTDTETGTGTGTGTETETVSTADSDDQRGTNE
ncbi:efflux RND transporter permease subunit [Natronorubrum daqingense]|uniref:MMPL family protein n=1 Tax=Natronorubrum daqingense TaxID=588898 RepID=A0A1N7C7M0_9EURY|nr:MMPL family transporter [Natronorubrum daqingense]APX96775.1 hypothetical protein BB347_09170 [Natronorubrum daqingense]SIR59513.1 MMPL family protein [Natronorubrum daqingense]